MSKRVADHYNARPQGDKIQRLNSPIIQLKNMNNFIKSRLIGMYTAKNSAVIDIACGKGGDLIKWEKAEIKSLLGLDIASKSIEEAQNRFNTSRSPLRYVAEFKTVDCFSNDLKKVLDGTLEFDVVSVQFAFHYCFESYKKVDDFLSTISKAMKPKGYFYGTVPNSALIVKMRDLHGKKFGNRHYYIEFVSESLTDFACKYVFKLEDAIDECPEYLVPIEKLFEMAKSHGLNVVKFQGFHEFFMEQAGKDLELVQRMRVFDRDGNVSKDQWEALGIYSVFCFQKS